MFLISILHQEDIRSFYSELPCILIGMYWVSQENTSEGLTETHYCSFFPYKQVSGRNGDHEWLRMTNAFILWDWVWQVQKCHAANREGSFK